MKPYDLTDLERYEAHFDCFDQEVPEVPLIAQIGPEEAFISGFFNRDGYQIDLSSIRDEPDGIPGGPAIEQYDSIVRLAYRLYERAVRGEPAFVGYTDPKRHRRLTIRQILNVTLPLDRRLPHRERRQALWERHRARVTEQGIALRRVSLCAENEISAGFPTNLVLDVCTRSDGFPHRVGHVLGVADTGRPLIITEDGDLRVSDTVGFFTNLMGCQMEPRERLLVWADHCQRSQIFRISQVEALTSAESQTEFD